MKDSVWKKKSYLSGIGWQKSEEGDLRFVVGAIHDIFFWLVVESVSVLHISEVHVSAEEMIIFQ